MKRKFYSMFLLFVLVLSLTGCAKVVHAETKSVDATVVSTYFKPAWTQPVLAGKTTVIITHPAQYQVTLEYEGEKYFLYSYSAYDKCKDLKGEKVSCEFRVKKYDNGRINNDIIGLWEE